MKEEKKYSGSKTRNYFTVYLLASIHGEKAPVSGKAAENIICGGKSGG